MPTDPKALPPEELPDAMRRARAWAAGVRLPGAAVDRVPGRLRPRGLPSRDPGVGGRLCGVPMPPMGEGLMPEPGLVCVGGPAAGAEGEEWERRGERVRSSSAFFWRWSSGTDVAGAGRGGRQSRMGKGYAGTKEKSMVSPHTLTTAPEVPAALDLRFFCCACWSRR